MSDRILSLQQVLDEKIVPLSRSSLYRLLKDEDSPFWKRRGRWMTVESDLYAWVRGGEKISTRQKRGNPMPRSKPGSAADLLARAGERAKELA